MTESNSKSIEVLSLLTCVCLYWHISIYHLALHPKMGGRKIKMKFAVKLNLACAVGFTIYYPLC